MRVLSQLKKCTAKVDPALTLVQGRDVITKDMPAAISRVSSALLQSSVIRLFCHGVMP